MGWGVHACQLDWHGWGDLLSYLAISTDQLEFIPVRWCFLVVWAQLDWVGGLQSYTTQSFLCIIPRCILMYPFSPQSVPHEFFTFQYFVPSWFSSMIQLCATISSEYSLQSEHTKSVFVNNIYSWRYWILGLLKFSQCLWFYELSF